MYEARASLCPNGKMCPQDFLSPLRDLEKDSWFSSRVVYIRHQEEKDIISKADWLGVKEMFAWLESLCLAEETQAQVIVALMMVTF